MDSGNPFKHWLAGILAVIPIAYLLVQWNTIPARVALHFGPDGKPDRYGGKPELLVSIVMMTIIGLLCYALVTNAHKLDKKKFKDGKPPIFDTIALATMTLISVLSLAIVINSIHPDIVLLGKVVMPAIGLFFVFMGNVMYNIRPNSFVGVRVPWTLKDEDNWKKTHRVSARLFFVGGLLITLVALFFDTRVASMFTTGVSLVIALASVLYSYLYYKNNKKANIQ
ncbi:MAG: SdpI family protein [Taibaiella sp.]|nr:SdpI family protein [Taibaiella sp.]